MTQKNLFVLTSYFGMPFGDSRHLESPEKAATDRARGQHTRSKTNLGSIISSHVKEFGLGCTLEALSMSKDISAAKKGVQKSKIRSRGIQMHPVYEKRGQKILHGPRC